jgi:hypothetical protein
MPAHVPLWPCCNGWQVHDDVERGILYTHGPHIDSLKTKVDAFGVPTIFIRCISGHVSHFLNLSKSHQVQP